MLKLLARNNDFRDQLANPYATTKRPKEKKDKSKKKIGSTKKEKKDVRGWYEEGKEKKKSSKYRMNLVING